MRIVSLIVCLLYCKLAMFLLLFACRYEKKNNDCDCGNSDVRFCNIKKGALYLGMGKVRRVQWYSVCPVPMRLSRKGKESTMYGILGPCDRHMGPSAPVCLGGCSRRLGCAARPHKQGVWGATLRLLEDGWMGSVATLTRAKTADPR